MLPPAFNTNTLRSLARFRPGRPPRAGRNWAPIPHAALVECLLDELLNVVGAHGRAVIATGRRGGDLAVSVEVPALSDAAGRFVPAIGAVSSNVRRHALRWYGGAWCPDENAGVVTDGFAGTPHTADVDLRAEVGYAVREWAARARRRAGRPLLGLDDGLPAHRAHAVFAAAGRTGLIAWSGVGAALGDFLISPERTRFAAACAFGRAGAVPPGRPIRFMADGLGFTTLLTQPAAETIEV